MAKLLSACPKCGTKNEVRESVYMRLDQGTGVRCEKCGIRFHAIIDEEDDKALFNENLVYPKIIGEQDYILKSKCCPK